MKKVPFICLLFSHILLLVAQKPQLIPPISHAEEVEGLAISPDGKYVLTGAGQGDNTALLWTLEGRLLMVLPGHISDLLDVEIAPNGKYMLTLETKRNSLHIWNDQGALLKTLSDSLITSVVFTPDGKNILAGNQNGELSLYDLNGQLIETFESPSEEAHTLLDVTYSPKGKYFASADDVGNITIYGSNGEILHLLNVGETPVTSITFSANEQQLLAATENKEAFSIDVASGEASILGTLGSQVAFSLDGKYFAIGGDELHIFSSEGNPQGTPFKAVEFWTNKIAFTPDGKSIVVAGGEKGAKRYDLQGNLLSAYSNKSSPVTTTGFSSALGQDTLVFFTGGQAMNIRLWNTSSNEVRGLDKANQYDAPATFHATRPRLFFAPHTDSLTQVDLISENVMGIGKAQGFTISASALDVHPLNDQQYLIATYDGDLQLCDIRLNPNRSVGVWKQGYEQGYVSSLKFSPDGKLFVQAFSKGTTPSMTYTTQKDNHPHNSEGLPARLCRSADGSLVREFGSEVDQAVFSSDGAYIAGNDGLGFTVWETKTGKEILHREDRDDDYTIVSSLVFARDGQSIIAGYSDNVIRRYSLSGTLLATLKGHISIIRTLAVSPDGKYLLSGSSDNTAKIWDLAAKKEILNLMALGNEDWLAITPEGLFDASSGAMESLYFVLGKEIIELDQLKERYYEPGLIGKLLTGSKDELRDVSSLDKVALYPELTASLSGTKLTAMLKTRSGGMGKLSFFINGKEILEDANPQRLTSVTIDITKFETYFLPENNTLSLRAYDKTNWIKSQALEIIYNPTVSSKGSTGAVNTPTTPLSSLKPVKPHLYAIVVGTAKYKGEQLNLEFTDQDAIAMAQAIEILGKRLFEDRIHIKLLTTQGKTPNEIPSKANIEAAFKEYEQAKASDIFIAYFSGHGVARNTGESGQFYYLTKDIASDEMLNDPETRKKFALSSEDLTRMLTKIPALKQVMIIDACNSGKVVDALSTLGKKDLNTSQVRAIERMKDRTGIFILTGSAADKLSFEASEYGQSLLTYSLLLGMSGLALKDDKMVDVMTLFQYARDKVPELAKAIGSVQVPILSFPLNGSSFDIGIGGPDVKIPVSQKKPVFVRNTFLNAESLDDDLKLGEALEKHFHTITAKGTSAELIYVDIKEHPNAYSIRANYSVTQNTVSLRGKLFKGKTAVGTEFQVKGETSNIPQIVADIMSRVSERIK